MKYSQKAILACTMIVTLGCLVSSCGVSSLSNCYPNFTQGGISLQITPISNTANEFTFEVCNNTNFIGQQVSVYGGTSAAEFTTMTPANNVRLAHFTDGLYIGDVFDVEFQNSDTSFAIYEDDASGNLANTTQVIEGDGFRN